MSNLFRRFVSLLNSLLNSPDSTDAKPSGSTVINNHNTFIIGNSDTNITVAYQLPPPTQSPVASPREQDGKPVISSSDQKQLPPPRES